MARYAVVEGGTVTNIVEWDGVADDEGWSPPADAEAVASDEAQIGWAYDGASFAPPAPPPPVVPQAVTPRQLRLALLGAGKLDQINAFVASAAVPPAARISWEYATEYRRDDAMLNQMAAVLEPPLSPAQIDALFVAAAAIQ